MEQRYEFQDMVPQPYPLAATWESREYLVIGWLPDDAMHGVLIPVVVPWLGPPTANPRKLPASVVYYLPTPG